MGIRTIINYVRNEKHVGTTLLNSLSVTNMNMCMCEGVDVCMMFVRV